MAELTGAEHYRAAERLLAGLHALGILKPHQQQVFIAEAQAHATLALAAATALRTTQRFVGDSAEITDWAKAIQPTALKSNPEPPEYPEFWPPTAGHIWQDRHGDRWICTQAPQPYLTCIARQADDNAHEIWRAFGPMTFVSRTDPSEVECPF